jgi:hypothetical protein
MMRRSKFHHALKLDIKSLTRWCQMRIISIRKVQLFQHMAKNAPFAAVSKYSHQISPVHAHLLLIPKESMKVSNTTIFVAEYFMNQHAARFGFRDVAIHIQR